MFPKTYLGFIAVRTFYRISKFELKVGLLPHVSPRDVSPLRSTSPPYFTPHRFREPCTCVRGIGLEVAST